MEKMTAKQKLLAWLEQNGGRTTLTTPAIAEATGLTLRSATSAIRELQLAGRLSKRGIAHELWLR